MMNDCMIKVAYILSSSLVEGTNVVQIKVDGLDCTVNASMLHFYMGDSYEIVWQPKVGMKVLVYFIDGNINRGVILGFLEKKDHQNILEFSEDGDRAAIKYENGIQIDFANKENERKIEINTPKEELISLDLDNQIFELKNKKSSETLSVSFNLKDSKISIKSDDLSIESKKITVKGDSLSVELDNDCKFKCGSFKTESNGGVDIQANAALNLKGQVVNLN